MAMNNINKYAFYQWIEDGDQHMHIGETNLRFNDLSAARNEFWHAITCYSRAVEIANQDNDILAVIAKRDLCNAQNAFDKLSTPEMER